MNSSHLHEHQSFAPVRAQSQNTNDTEPVHSQCIRVSHSAFSQVLPMNCFGLTSSERSREILIEKHWTDNVKRAVCDTFWEEVTKAPSKEEVKLSPSSPQHCLAVSHLVCTSFSSFTLFTHVTHR